ncbi:MAG: peptide ABC transporter substrate-binding protein [Steroidobacteraceae bacterium]
MSNTGAIARRLGLAAAGVVAALVGTACDDRPAAVGTPPSATELRRGLGAEPETLDPRQASDNASLAIVGDLYEGLTTEAAEGAIVPGAAERWTVSADGLRWTFALRPGLRWSNGDPLTSRDYAAGIGNVLAPGSTAPNAPLLDGIAAVDAPDDTTLVLTLGRPMPYLPSVLALPVAAPLNARDPAVGNGPYRLVEWRRGRDVLLERNERYRDAGHVAIGRVRHVTVPDLRTEFNLFRTGALALTSEVPNENLPYIRATLPGRLRTAPYLNTYAYAANLRRLGDRDARRALAMAIDRERITGQVTGAGERPAYEWVAPGLPGYPGAHYTWSTYDADGRVAGAREAWQHAAARGGAPTRIVLCTDASANHRRTAVALADQWRTTLGVDTEIVELEWNVYLDTLANPKDCDLVRLGWSADFADPEAFAAVFATGHPQNTFGYSSSAYDALLAESRTTTDPARRMELLSSAERQLLEDVPVIPVFHRVTKRLVAPGLEGDFSNPLGHLASRDLAWSTTQPPR